MKFTAVIFLGFCALIAIESVQAESRYPYPVWRGRLSSGIQATVEELIQKAIQELLWLSQKVNGIVKAVQHHIEYIVAEGKDKLNSLKNDVFDKIQKLKQKEGNIKKCAEKLETEFHQIQQIVHSETFNCGLKMTENFQKFCEHVEKDVVHVKDLVEKFRHDAKDCATSKIIANAKCVLEKLRALFVEISYSTKEVLDVARDRAVDVIAEVRACNTAVFAKAAESIKKLNSKLAKC